MSFNSPAKQERIERHLMRQRGAGARTVSSNFGFAFGPSSAPTSSDATPTREIEAPPAKRRKTILPNELVVAEHTVERPVTAPKSTKVVKSRRRLALDDFEEKAQSNAVTADDSFLAGLKTKKARTAKTKTIKKPPPAREVPVEVVNVRSAASGRTRRLAAATAAARVAEGFEEEAAPIDRKKRDAAPIQKTSKSRKNRVPQAEEGFVLEDSIKGDSAATDRKRPLPKRQTAGRKRKAAVLDVVDEKDELAVSVAVRGRSDTTRDQNANWEQALAPKPAPKSRTKMGVRAERKHKQNGKELTVQTRSSEDNSSHSIQQPPIADIGPPPSPRNKRMSRKRQPLAAADMNITIRSSSPEKMPQDHPKLPVKPPPKSSTPSQGLPHHQKVTKPANKRRKLNVQRDAGEDATRSPAAILQPEPNSQKGLRIHDTKGSKQSLMDNVSGSANASRSNRSAKTAAQPQTNFNKSEKVEDSGAKRGVSKQSSTTLAQEDGPGPGRFSTNELRGNSAGTMKPRNVRNSTKGEENAAVSQPDSAEEEDVDWLFAPQPQARVPKTSTAKSKSKGATASRKFKMPEMDLDDLLSNIATFAQAKTTSVPAFADNGLFHGQEKGRGGGRKKAKGRSGI